MAKKHYLVTGGSGFIGSAVARRLLAEGFRVRVLDNNFRGQASRLADLGDAVEFIELHPDRPVDAVDDVLRAADPLGPAAEVKTLLDDIISGRRRTVRWPWPTFTHSTRSLLPGTITLIAGDGGATKSLFVIEAAAHWYSEGIKVAVMEMEDGRAYHARRVLAQRAEAGALFDDDWIAQHPDQTRALYEQHTEFLDGFGRCIHDPAADSMTLVEVAEWVEQQALIGCRVSASTTRAIRRPCQPLRVRAQLLHACKRLGEARRGAQCVQSAAAVGDAGAEGQER